MPCKPQKCIFCHTIPRNMSPDSGPTCGGIRQGSSQSWGSYPRSLIQRRGSPGRTPCKKFRRSGVCPLPPQNPGQTFPSTPCLPKIKNHCQPVVDRCGKYPPKAFKFRHGLQRSTVVLKVHRCAHLHLLLPQTPDFLPHLIGAHCHGLMIPIQSYPGNKHITSREGVVSLL